MRMLEIIHRTRYEYSEPVALGEYRLMFRPRDSHDLRLLHTRLSIEPDAQVRWIHDPFGNSIAIATFGQPATSLDIASSVRLDHYGMRPELPAIEEYARRLPFSYRSEEAPDLGRYVERHYPDPDSAVAMWARAFVDGEAGGDTFGVLCAMCAGIQRDFHYAMRFEAGTQAPADTLATKGGTCRDFALLMIEAVRSFGLAARFVTGYLYDPALDETLGMETKPAFPHAWMEVYLPGAGWIEFDPTNGIVGTDRLIRVGVGRDPEQAMPIKGSFMGPPGACISTFVDVKVRTVTPEPVETSKAQQELPTAA
jgi:transglutaminase-like putative cysteine protease